jgi:hypothetical protein
MPRKTSQMMPRVVGAEALGVTKKVTADIVRALRTQLDASGRRSTIRSVRFITSSRADNDDGSFEVLANTLIDLAPSEDRVPRAEALGAVVKVGHSGRAQTLEGLQIPALRLAAA